QSRHRHSPSHRTEPPGTPCKNVLHRLQLSIQCNHPRHTSQQASCTRPLPLHLHLDKILPDEPPTNCKTRSPPFLHHHSKHWLSKRLCAEPTHDCTPTHLTNTNTIIKLADQ